MAQKSIFGMTELYISAGHEYASHADTPVVDLSGMDSGIDQFRAPFDYKVREIFSRDNNTVIFESTTPVELPIGTFDTVCFRCTHMDDYYFDQLNIVKDRTFRRGETCYYEGQKGETSGNHVHVEFAVGKYVNLQNMAITLFFC